MSISAYPQSSNIGEQINRFREIGREWPSESSEMKDGSKCFRVLTSAPVRRFRIDYEAISKTWYDTLAGHYDSCKGSAETFAFVHPYSSSSITVRYAKFTPTDPGQKAPNPNVYPWLSVELEEAL